MTVQYSAAEAAPAVLDFWFDEVGADRWFVKSDLLDERIRTRFGLLRREVVASGAQGWRSTPLHLLAAIIVLDQFGRNLHRGSAEAFAADPIALELTLLGLARGWETSLIANQRQFLLMPLMHSEQLADQEQSMIEFERLGNSAVTGFAKRHLDQIVRFGRFPGRNAVLGRRTTEEEQDALDNGAAF